MSVLDWDALLATNYLRQDNEKEKKRTFFIHEFEKLKSVVEIHERATFGYCARFRESDGREMIFLSLRKNNFTNKSYHAINSSSLIAKASDSTNVLQKTIG